MSIITRLFPSFLSSSSKSIGTKLIQSTSNFHSVASAVQKLPQDQSLANPGGLFGLTTRSMVRFHFPRPSERKRVKRHGWQKRVSTPEGRRVLMNRILKGRWVYSH